jgi:hypothetical protein
VLVRCKDNNDKQLRKTVLFTVKLGRRIYSRESSKMQRFLMLIWPNTNTTEIQIAEDEPLTGGSSESPEKNNSAAAR